MYKKIMIIPDSFKGSMTSVQVSEIIAEIAEDYGCKEIVMLPIADGGEGSTDCILNTLGGIKRNVSVISPEHIRIDAFFGITDDNTAIIEIAESSGLTKQTTYNASEATSYGFGELIKTALDCGCRNFVLCLGGSATTDAGCGMAAALGVKFFDLEGKEFIPVGRTMKDVAGIDLSYIDKRVSESSFTVMSDVKNVLYGSEGAAYIYGPQKGAVGDEIRLLDDGLRNICEVYHRCTGKNLADIEGGGAAGGVGFGCVAFLGAVIQSGIETMLKLLKYKEKLAGCEHIFTGEGRIDEQSMMGKVLYGIRTNSGDIPITAVCGISSAPKEILEKQNISVIEIGRGIPLEDSIRNAKDYLRSRLQEYFRDLA